MINKLYSIIKENIEWDGKFILTVDGEVAEKMAVEIISEHSESVPGPIVSFPDPITDDLANYKTVTVNKDLVLSCNARIISFYVSQFSMYSTPSESGIYVLPDSVYQETFKKIRSVLINFDVEGLLDMRNSILALDKGVVSDNYKISKDNWKKLAKDKYFKNMPEVLDEILESIYDLKKIDESELLPKRSHIAVRVHKDDIISSNDLRMEYLTIKEYNIL